MIKCNNKQIRSAYNRYLNSYMENLFDAYKNPSSKKREAWKYCESLSKDLGGYESLKVVSAGINTFSAGFIGYPDGVRSFIYITKDYDRYMPLLEN